MERELVLVINPGSTSTKLAIFKGSEKCIQENLDHDTEKLDQFEKIADQYDFRKTAILEWLAKQGVETAELIAVVGRGGLLRPMPSGAYKVTEPMVKDLQIGYQGEHASNLGGLIAKAIADGEGIDAFIVDPVAVDEFEPLARISGMPEIERRSLVHALNIRAIAHSYAKDIDEKIENLNLVVAHLGGGISIVPMKKGKIIDANNANEMGPFSPERAGGLPVGDIARMAFSGEFTHAELKKKMRGKGGMTAYLGTNDAREVLKRIEAGDEEAKCVFEAMGYQIAKEIGGMATVLNGDVDAILLTGGVAYSTYLTDFITEHVGFISKVVVKPGEDEMEALNLGFLRVHAGEEKAKIYENEVTIND
ncbi:butyrate kinase [Fusibacter sp. JL298sf-3]